MSPKPSHVHELKNELLPSAAKLLAAVQNRTDSAPMRNDGSSCIRSGNGRWWNPIRFTMWLPYIDLDDVDWE
jgi:hypothetical protein